MTQYKYNCSGPWDNEPDNETWIDGKTGLTCEIRRHPSLGHLCGYVCVPADHPAVGLPIDDHRIPNDEIHGGVTFAGSMEEAWWIGFDCGHCGDFSPGLSMGKEYTDNGCHYRCWKYTRRHVEKLARCLAEMTQYKDPRVLATAKELLLIVERDFKINVASLDDLPKDVQERYLKNAKAVIKAADKAAWLIPDSAPLDGDEIILRIRERGVMAGYWSAIDDRWICRDGDLRVRHKNITGWQPLPSAGELS